MFVGFFNDTSKKRAFIISILTILSGISMYKVFSSIAMFRLFCCVACSLSMLSLAACDPKDYAGPATKDTTVKAREARGISRVGTVDTLGGRVIYQTIAVGNRLFSSSAEGLFWSNDWGKTWMKITGNGFPDIINPSDSRFNGTTFVYEQQGMMLLGRKNGGVWLSLDSGRAWKQIISDNYLPISGGIYDQSSIFLNKDTLLVPMLSRNQGTSYILLSTNKGETWSEVQQSVGVVTFSSFWAVNDKVFAFGRRGEVFSSDRNTGLTQWTRRENIPDVTATYSFLPLGENTLLMNSPVTGLFKTTDACQSWQSANNGLARGYTNIAINDKYIFVTLEKQISATGYSFDGVYWQSKTGPAKWERLNIDAIIPPGKTINTSDNGLYVFCLHATNDRLIIGTNGDGVKTYKFKNPFP